MPTQLDDSGGLELSTPLDQNQKRTRMPSLWSLHAPKPPGHGLLVEPEHYQAYSAYAKNQNPDTADAILKSINPIIEESLRSYAGSEADTVTAKARAKKLALEALRKYDPSRAKLRTHLLSHLRGLRRQTERATAGVYQSEQPKMDSRHTSDAYADLRDELNREPSDAEIADRTKLPIERVRKARSVQGVLSSSQHEGQTEATGTNDKAHAMWVESVYHDLSDTDKVILENSFGLHGKEPVAANVIAKMLKLSPGAISQRKSRIQGLLDQFDEFMGAANR